MVTVGTWRQSIRFQSVRLSGNFSIKPGSIDPKGLVDRPMINLRRLNLISFALTGLSLAVLPVCLGAEDLSLREGVSFSQDIDAGFPIVGKHMNDAVIATDSPTLIFFGASGDLNTNRQAARLVILYNQLRGKNLKFIVIDVGDLQSEEAKSLVGKYYKGYIPSQVLIDGSGRKVWSRIGEVELKVVKKQIRKLI